MLLATFDNIQYSTSVVHNTIMLCSFQLQLSSEFSIKYKSLDIDLCESISCFQSTSI